MGKQRYLITGGGGFIGSHIAESLVKSGQEVVVLDNMTTGRRQNLDAVLGAATANGPTPRIIEGDLRDEGTVRNALDGVTHVLHQAALPSVPRSISDPAESHDVNATGTLTLLIAARDAAVARFVYASSSSVYGDSKQLPKVETMATAPLSPYAVNKLAAEHYCAVFHRLYGLETIALRYFNIFGPRQDPASQYAAVVPRFITAALQSEAPLVYGDGLQSRDFTYIDNAVQANLRACDAPAAAAGRAYNVACGASATLMDILEIIAKVTDRPLQSRHEEPRAGDVRHSLAGIEAARKQLGYDPSIDLEEGLRRTIDWFRQ